MCINIFFVDTITAELFHQSSLIQKIKGPKTSVKSAKGLNRTKAVEIRKVLWKTEKSP